MIILPTTTTILRARLSASIVTYNPSFAFFYGNEPVGAGQATGSNSGLFDSANNVTLVGSPAANTSRIVKSGFIFNNDSAAVTVTIEYYDGVTAAQAIAKIIMPSGSRVSFGDDGFTLVGGATETQLLGVNAQTGTTYTLQLTDMAKDVQCGNASPVTLTIPSDASVPFPVNTLIAFSQTGAGAVTASPAAGVTLNGANGFATTSQYDGRVLQKVSANTWRCW